MKPAKFHDQRVQQMWDEGVAEYRQRRDEDGDAPYEWKFPLCMTLIPLLAVFLVMYLLLPADIWNEFFSDGYLLQGGVVATALFLMMFGLFNWSQITKRHY